MLHYVDEEGNKVFIFGVIRKERCGNVACPKNIIKKILMKIVPLNDVKNRFSHYLEQAKREDIIVTKNGRPEAVIHGITDEDLEDYLFETEPRFIARIEALREQYTCEGGKSLRRGVEGVGFGEKAQEAIKANPALGKGRRYDTNVTTNRW
jgi:prevent-host-death family protein